MHKTILAVVALTMVSFLASGMMARESTPKTDVKQVIFENGRAYDGQVPARVNTLTTAMKQTWPTATFKLDGSTLLVGLAMQEVATGEVLKIDVTNHCPVNSHFEYTPPAAKLASKVEPTLIALTRHLHEYCGLGQAPLESYYDNHGSTEVVLHDPTSNANK
jgi:hypothetical protein